MMSSRIGLLGGTFDPIHLGHLIIAERAAEGLDLDQVLFVPAQSPPHKPGHPILAAHHRAAMVKLAIAGNDRFAFSDLDLHTATPSYTSELVARACEMAPDAQFFFIAGADSLRDFPTWHEPRIILEHATLAIARRPGVIIDEAMLSAVPGLRSRVRLFDSPLIEISATDIRERIGEGRDIRYLVPENVREYIRKHHLYR